MKMRGDFHVLETAAQTMTEAGSVGDKLFLDVQGYYHVTLPALYHFED